jgi:hypothetical protein
MKRLFLTLGLGVGLSILNSQFSTAFAIGTNQTVSATITITNPPTGMLGEWISIQGNVYTWTNAAPTYGQIQSVSNVLSCSISPTNSWLLTNAPIGNTNLNGWWNLWFTNSNGDIYLTNKLHTTTNFLYLVNYINIGIPESEWIIDPITNDVPDYFQSLFYASPVNYLCNSDITNWFDNNTENRVPIVLKNFRSSINSAVIPSTVNLFNQLTNDWSTSLRFAYTSGTSFTISTFVNKSLSISNSPGWMTLTLTNNIITGGNTPATMTVSNLSVHSLTLLDNTNGPNTITSWP